MSDVAIKVEGLGKRFKIGKRESYKTIRETVTSALAAPLRILRRQKDDPETILWALKDVNFEVQQGEAVGIIGRNGAGKSTLLKVLSRITDPTEGQITIDGRIGSLLEVGTGFHPELSGRENIYMNGAILGMRRAEIVRKFDAIVAFAEVERFIDTPVKRYSSGMYTRLAFAVAAHLEPEILIVDEVLAVGDAQFQKKCLGKMGEVAKEGRTVLFVSHNMNAIRSLCTTGIALDRGRVGKQGDVRSIIDWYLDAGVQRVAQYQSREQENKCHISAITLLQDGTPTASVAIDKPSVMVFEVALLGRRKGSIGVQIHNQDGVCVHHTSDEFCNIQHTDAARVRMCTLPAYSLAPGNYSVDVALGERNVELYEQQFGVLRFEVELVGKLSDRTQQSLWRGVCGPGLLQWNI